MNGGIAIMLKTPGLSPVKTRLAKSIGQKQAEDFHLLSSYAVASVIKQLASQFELSAYYAVAEQEALNHDYWQDLNTINQGTGGLGERMAYVYQWLLQRHQYAVLIGADIPQINQRAVLPAIYGLSNTPHNHQLCFAPSVDGGFWLIGGQCPIPNRIWIETEYSLATTGQQFLQAIQPLGNIQLLEPLSDIDEASDLPLLHQSLTELESMTQEQMQLFTYIETLL